jgi:hypothetical protein
LTVLDEKWVAKNEFVKPLADSNKKAPNAICLGLSVF